MHYFVYTYNGVDKINMFCGNRNVIEIKKMKR